MDNYLVYNGKFLLSNTPILQAGNRGFQYADGLFESIRVINGKPLFLNAHYQRLKEGAEQLSISFPENWTFLFFADLFQKLISLNNLSSGRARLSINREIGSGYNPTHKDVSFILELYPLDQAIYALNKNGISIDVYDKQVKYPSKLNSFKTLNAQLYIMALADVALKNIDDALVLNQAGNIIEASASNVFFVKDECIYTPPLSDGGVGGIMRMQVINIALEAGIKVFECHTTEDYLLDADEVFLTNAIKGIQWVVSFKHKRYYHKMSYKLLELLNNHVINLTMDLRENE